MSSSSSDDLDQQDADINKPKFLFCLFLDGIGIAPDTSANAFTAAKLPNFFNYVRDYPVTLLSGKTKDISRRYWALGCGQEDDSDQFLKAETCLSALIEEKGMRQMKIVASEQLLDLSLFFNNNRELAFSGEEIVCLSTPIVEDDLSTLSKQFMTVLDRNWESIEAKVVFASFPLIQETALRGNFAEIVTNLQKLDKLLPKIISPIVEAGGLVIITSPHGNVERTRDLASDWEDREATANPVPFLLIGSEYQGKTIGLADPLDNDLSVLAPAGTLADFAPTVLSLLGIEKPESMSGESLI